MTKNCHSSLGYGKRTLKDFFTSTLEDLLEEMDIDGWSSGGCWVAACGLLSWLKTDSPLQRESPLLAVIEGTRSPSSTRIPDHVVVMLSHGGVSYCMDSEGAVPVAEFLEEWGRVERLSACRVVSLNERQLLEAHIPFRPEISERIATALHETFGPWSAVAFECVLRQNGR